MTSTTTIGSFHVETMPQVMRAQYLLTWQFLGIVDANEPDPPLEKISAGWTIASDLEGLMERVFPNAALQVIFDNVDTAKQGDEWSFCWTDDPRFAGFDTGILYGLENADYMDSEVKLLTERCHSIMGTLFEICSNDGTFSEPLFQAEQEIAARLMEHAEA